MKIAKILALCIGFLLLVQMLPFSASAQNATHTVQKGDTLWLISRKYATTVAELKRLNNRTSDMIYVGDKMIVKQSAAAEDKLYVDYIVQKGDTLGLIAEAFGTKFEFIKSLNGMTSDRIIIGQKLKVPAEYKVHKVVSGDTLYLLAKANNTSVARISMYSGITSTNLKIGQILKIPYQNLAVNPTQPATQPAAKPTKAYLDYTVVKGDTIWGVAVKHGIPMQELLTDNRLNSESVLNLGQKLRVAQYNIPIKSTPGPQYGEYLDWWTEAQYVCPINKTLKITDFDTKKSFTIKRTIGACHADCEPLTKADAAAAKRVFGGYTWNTRAVIVEVDGRKIAGSMSYYPHGVEYITNNDFVGHFDLYFANCVRHVDGKPDPSHQAKVEKAAGKK